MDSLISDIGQPPYQWKDLLTVYEKGHALLKQIQSGAETYQTDIPAVSKTIDKLEALASICFRSVEMDLILYTMDATSQVTLDNHLAGTIWELKQELLRLQTPGFGLYNSNVCKSCAWIVQRTGGGLLTKNLWSSRYVERIPPWTANSYLCALDTWPDFPRLDALAGEGCELCRFVLDLLKKRKVDLDVNSPDTARSAEVCVWIDLHFDLRSQDADDASPIETGLLNRLSYGSILLTKAASTMNFPNLVWQFMVDSTDQEVAQELQVYVPPNSEAWGTLNVNFVKSRLSGGDDLQPDAANSTEIAFNPTRLLDLGLSEDAGVRLVITNELIPCEVHVKYAALSYCWGPPEDAQQQSTLTIAKLASLRQGISYKQLSPVMRDAVSVCRKLGIRYLWIDALCIIQDSRADWEQESQQMSRIYEKSHLTICAMASASCLEGFLPDRPRAKEFRYTSPLSSSKTLQTGGAFSLRPVPGYDLVELLAPPASDTAPLDQDMFLSRWNERGWVFQEKSMSPRKLYFGHSMIHLQLGNKVISENGYADTLEPHSWFADRMSDNIIPVGQLLTTGQHLYELWHTVVIRFAHLKWTKMQDIFPGLSGLAAKFDDSLRDKYLAGHWERDLGCSLVWTTTGGRRRDVKSAESVEELVHGLRGGNIVNGPSWSWASTPRFHRFLISALDGHMCRVRTHLRQEFSMLQSNVAVDGVNPYGALKATPNSLLVSGRLIDFSGILKSPEWSVVENSEWDCWNAAKGYLLQVSHDWEPDRNRTGWGNRWGVSGGAGERVLAEAETEQISKLKLLLLSSCCSDYSETALEGGNLRPGTEATNKVLFGHGYIKTFLDDAGYRPEDAACQYCRTEERRRDVWGLLLCPADATGSGKFFRVGVFSSRAALGGSALFANAAVAELELV
ncbi:heterokaryon incompatibility protein-domain-containing protein [Cladorrhinum sp. PSN259]|nr:heterokaryon incompatibility protein-domain-containing protein [Cladorrhinum sp. PSN259]